LRLICTSSVTKSLLEPSAFCMYRRPLSTLTFSPRGCLHPSSSSFAPVSTFIPVASYDDQTAGGVRLYLGIDLVLRRQSIGSTII
jgi:hypothetical protein